MIGSHPIASTPIAAGLAQQQAAGTGTIVRTLAGATVAATGKLSITGAITRTLAGATSLSNGTVLIQGSSARTLAGASLAATGTVGSNPISGSISRTLDAATVVATGTGPRTGSITTVLAGASVYCMATMAQPVGLINTKGDIGFGRPARMSPKAQRYYSALEEDVRQALGRFKGKRSKPRITPERLTAAAEAILNAPDIPEWEFKRVGDVISDILGAPFPVKPKSAFELGQQLLELAVDVAIEDDDEEAIMMIVQAEFEDMMSL